MSELVVLTLMGALGLLVALLLIGYGLRRLQAIVQRQQELQDRHERLFTYTQYKLAAQRSLQQAQRTKRFTARREALEIAVARLQKALDVYPEAKDAEQLREQLVACQEQLAALQEDKG
ncbi:MAG TPA: hypothetical protein EYP85_17270 [Armatimonadetes bacterium]|nr:hypothetical protein [Armatimonadota bacterium]